jgi:hypothetical protein
MLPILKECKSMGEFKLARKMDDKNNNKTSNNVS